MSYVSNQNETLRISGLTIDPKKIGMKDSAQNTDPFVTKEKLTLDLQTPQVLILNNLNDEKLISFYENS